MRTPREGQIDCCRKVTRRKLPPINTCKQGQRRARRGLLCLQCTAWKDSSHQQHEGTRLVVLCSRSVEDTGAFFSDNVFLLTSKELHPPSRCRDNGQMSGGGNHMGKSVCVRFTAPPTEDGQRRGGWKRGGD